MKINNYNWSLLRKLIVLTLLCFIAVSCGDKNKVKKGNNINNQSNPFGFNNNPGLSPQQNSQIANAISAIQCNYGGTAQTDNNRIRLPFKTSTPPQPGSNTTLMAQWSQGSSGGQISKTFIGRSSAGDVMVIYQNQNSYTMDLYLCPARNIQTGTWFIGGNAQLSNFNFSGYVLDNDVNCGKGAIDAGSFSFFSNTAGTVGKQLSKVCWQ